MRESVIEHRVDCPVCAAEYAVKTQSDEVPAALPCSRCWRDLTPEDRAPWLARLRAAPQAQQVLIHRDPVRYAPPTLAAYVAHLEEALAQRAAAPLPQALDPAA